jgi:hypothetical protein
MGLQSLGPRKVRRLARITGLDIVHAVAGGGYTYGFVTSDHRHGWYEMKTGEWALEDPGDDADPYAHWSSCLQRWPEHFDPVTRRYIG